MTQVYDAADLAKWLEVDGDTLFWVSFRDLGPTDRRRAKDSAPREFKDGDFAYWKNNFPRGRRKRGLSGEEFWFRGQVLNGERVIAILNMLK